jgi:hypothetical protein
MSQAGSGRKTHNATRSEPSLAPPPNRIGRERSAVASDPVGRGRGPAHNDSRRVSYLAPPSDNEKDRDPGRWITVL